LLDNIRQLLGNSRVVAMGEIGLDFTTPEMGSMEMPISRDMISL
jgi:predicted metal-dependent TIM-barrel fold hydrolase